MVILVLRIFYVKASKVSKPGFCLLKFFLPDTSNTHFTSVVGWDVLCLLWVKSNLFLNFFIAQLGAVIIVSFWAALEWHSVVSYHLQIWKVAWENACQIWHHHLGPISITIFPSQLKFDGNFVFALIMILTRWALQNFTYDMIAVLSCHV